MTKRALEEDDYYVERVRCEPKRPRLDPAPAFVYFRSSARAPYYMFSNFWGGGRPIPFTMTAAFRELRPDLAASPPAPLPPALSAEHLWHAIHKAGDDHSFRLLLTGGWDSALVNVFPEAKRSQKVAYWRDRCHNMVGILPKMAVNPTHAKKVKGLVLRRDTDEMALAPDLMARVWADIHAFKYAANVDAAAHLMATGSLRLVELDGRATPTTFWAGRYVDGVLVGHNTMGRFMEAARARLLLLANDSS